MCNIDLNRALGNNMIKPLNDDVKRQMSTRSVEVLLIVFKCFKTIG